MAVLLTEGKNGRFRTALSCILVVGVAPNSPRVSRDVSRLTQSLKPVATIVFKICAIYVKIFV